MRAILEIKILLLRNKKLLHVTHLISIISCLYDICIIYVHVIVVCLKVIIAIFYFCHSKSFIFSFFGKNPSNIMKIIFFSISIYC